MTYFFLKSLHILAAILWIGSLFLISYVSSKNKIEQKLMNSSMRITEFAIGMTWLLGIILVILGSWYYSPWWYIKVALLVVISAIHTFHHRRWKNLDSNTFNTNKNVPYLILVLACLIVILVVFKRPM